ncbi:dimethyl sulfoxide reductase [Nocardioides sp. GY 10113]|uniref:dimethyl sulfoxide reductase anchor subunit family protein n=1 Tax=Nocardioides sp. GY 10113 TaxID=2569761 RepID=UPI0010A8D3E0|nr:DmsC/YnfH family molybdoenzyme membrane anchor subunit [Nocardioides sp. GY 10113]TIC88785.1 dimethyl sulfoxide reductase [Nocardioides sp. GY 10113]
MSLHDLPMVLFTVFTQMAVGTFLALGVVFLATLGKPKPDRVIDPVLYAIGPALVFGLAVSTLHMHDITHTLNVIRHWNSSWLTREILFGVAFAGVGFLFALLAWFQIGSRTMRQVVAFVAALLGIGLVWAQSMVYYSLRTVPAWRTWEVPFFFFATTVLLGALAVGAAIMVTTVVRAWHASRAADADGTGGAAPEAGPATGADPGTETSATGSGGGADAGGTKGGIAVQTRARVAEINAPTTEEEWQLTVRILRAIAAVGAATAVAILVVYPVYLADLGRGDAAAQATLDEMTDGPMLWIRLVLLGLTAVVLGVFVYRMAETTPLAQARSLALLVLLCFAMALASELLGRTLHYTTQIRVGI